MRQASVRLPRSCLELRLRRPPHERRPGHSNAHTDRRTYARVPWRSTCRRAASAKHAAAIERTVRCHGVPAYPRSDNGSALTVVKVRQRGRAGSSTRGWEAEVLIERWRWQDNAIRARSSSDNGSGAGHDPASYDCFGYASAIATGWLWDMPTLALTMGSSLGGHGGQIVSLFARLLD